MSTVLFPPGVACLPGMGLGAVTSDRLGVGKAASITDLKAFTLITLARVLTLTANRAFYGSTENTTDVPSAIQLRLSGTVGNVELRVAQSPTALSFITSDTPFATNYLRWLAASYDNGAATPRAHIYSGLVGQLLRESTYGTQTNGSASRAAENGTGEHTWGNRSLGSASYSNALQGSQLVGAFFNRALGLKEILSFTREPRRMIGCVGLYFFGEDGDSSRVPDRSGYGNRGTLTGTKWGVDALKVPRGRARHAIGFLPPAAFTRPAIRTVQQAVNRGASF